MTNARGADFSSYQDDTHLKAAVHNGISFAIIKLTQGVDYVNPRAHEQASKLARLGGTRIGAYHFLTHDVDGAAQWDYFEQHLHGIIGPVACDQESDRGVLVSDAIAEAFIRRGHQRGFKVGRYGDGRVFPRSLGEDWRWCAWWAKTPPPWKWDVWQFEAGTGGAPDWNVFHGNVAQLATWTKSMEGHAKQPLRWWLHDDLTKTARGPFRLPALGAAVLAYLARHPRSNLIRLERK